MGWPLAGVGTCKYHGGGSAASRRKHKRTLLRNEEQRQLALNERRFQPIVDADPATVLIDLVRQQAGIVAYLRERLETVSEDAKTSIPQAKQRRLSYVATFEVLPQ